MLSTLTEFLFGCTHRKTSFPISTRAAKAHSKTGTYVVCLDCGKEFPYNWEEMRLVSEREQQSAGVPEHVESF